ncbi:hypothetical protein [Geotalea sp. SG265]|uniref:hypothetical protein n=1 Tax=Geotalea sp. SG265 TaxID=2922867 RepID=UPI001FAEB929|nr:hypothetical protein [Geotalea sp. SG265]
MTPFVYWLMIAAGLAAIVWGLPAAHRLKAPFDSVAALVALLGLIAALLGALLVAVPGFFQG